MALLTVTQMRDHVETGLTDAALERVIEAEDSYMVKQVGQHDPVPPATTMVYQADNHNYGTLWLTRPAESIESVVDRDGRNITSNLTLTWGGRGLRSFEYYVYYTRPLTVTFVPVSENAERMAALVQLVQLAVQYTGLEMESDDTYRIQQRNLTMERKRIIAPLRHSYGGAGLVA